MYKVEYLVVIDSDKTKCRTVKSLKSLLESDSDIEIDKGNIIYKGFSAPIVIKLGKKEDISNLFFDITLNCISENDIPKFTELLRAVRTSLNLITPTNYVIWDDLSLFHAQQAYPVIFDIENLMRQLITKFMLTNIGVTWTKDRVPTDVQQSINPNNKDLNYLNNVDFIQLKNFLFSENYPNDKESLIQKLKTAKDLSNLNLDEIKSLIPNSNWNKYFEPLVGCDADYLKKRWDRLYDLRTSIAHNKPFTKTDLEEVKKLSSELKPYLEKALSSLDKIIIAEEERENLAENAVISFSQAFGSFIIKFQQLEKFLYSLSNHVKINKEKTKLKSFGNQSGFLLDKGIISEKQYSALKLIYYLRNDIVHSSEIPIGVQNLTSYEDMIEELIQYFKQYFKDNINGK